MITRKQTTLLPRSGKLLVPLVSSLLFFGTAVAQQSGNGGNGGNSQQDQPTTDPQHQATSFNAYSYEGSDCNKRNPDSGGREDGWKVTDGRSHDQLKTANGTLAKIEGDIGCHNSTDINNRLKKLYDQMSFDTYRTTQNMGIPKEPDLKLDDASPVKDPAQSNNGANSPDTVTDVGVDQRCPTSTDATSSMGTMATQQTAICKMMYNTQLAKYKYTMRMYEVSKLRQKRLTEIQNDRLGIPKEDQGRLQDNNNKLLELLAQMDIDRQQQKLYMDAYDARITYLQNTRDTLTSTALGGNKGSSGGNGGSGPSLPSGMDIVLGGLTMETVLSGLHTNNRYNH